jgi:sugar lactone lactonase YvrE
MRKWYYFVPVLLISSLLFADGTQSWEQSSYDEFEKGTSKGVAIHSNGHLELAPPLKAISTTPSTFLWALAADATGDIYAAAGSPARVYRITPQGQVSIIFEPQELQVQSLLVDKDGTLYAATSPDGKVYRIVRKAGVSFPAAPVPTKKDVLTEAEIPKNVPVDSAYTATVLFEPKTKYIWDLAEDSQGRVYVATGDTGEIFRIEKNGTGALFFKSDEAHIRVLTVDRKDTLIAGSDGSGLIYRISQSGDAFVLYSANKKEITALVVDPNGNIYAAGVGDKRTASTTPMVTPLPTGAAPGTTTGPTALPTASALGATRSPALPVGITGGSEIYRIAPDGSPNRIWSSREDVVYALGFDRQHHLLAGTGNTGRIFTVLDDDSYIDIGRVSATQVTCMIQAPAGGLYLGTSNLGKIFELGGSAANDGNYESDVFDAKIFSHWGRTAIRGTGAFDVYARSGNVDNPDRNWSGWSKVDLAKDASVGVPPARFLQWKVVLHPSNPAPNVDSVLVNYLSKNVAPEISEVYVQPGARFPIAPKNAENVPVSVGPATGGAQGRFEVPAVAVRDRDSIAVRWSARDDNDDSLVYSVYYRGEGETAWKLLKGELTDKYYSFDSNVLPDGGYTLKVAASDAPSHSPEEALMASKLSSYFEIDNTPPEVLNLSGAYEQGAIHLTFRAIDGFSPIQRAEYSIDAGNWQVIEPIGQISDNRVENYDVSLGLPRTPKPDSDVVVTRPSTRPEIVVKAIKKVPESKPAEPTLAPQEHVVIVRVYDRFDNMGSAKVVVRAK